MKAPLILAIAGIFAFFILKIYPDTEYPGNAWFKPTNGDPKLTKMGESEDKNKDLRQAWFEMMHPTPPGKSWEAIEYDNQKRRNAARKQQQNRNDGMIADGLISGTWFERGSNNQAGSVVATDYDPDTDGIYLISADGSIFYGERDGSAWYVVNDQFQFSNRFLKMLNTNKGKRMIAAPFKTPHYSNDYGQNWKASTGIEYNQNTDRWLGEGFYIEKEENFILVPSKPSYWSTIQIFLSKDNGESYQSIFDVGSHESSRFYLSKVEKSNEVYLAVKANDNTIDLYLFDDEQEEFILKGTSSDIDLTDTRQNLASVQVNDSITRHYVYTKQSDKIYKSEDQGNSWKICGNLPNSPWYKGLFVPQSAPNMVLTAGVELFRSSDEAENFSLVNAWWEYYSDVPNKLHADFMDIREFWTADSIPFILLSNHGGLSITYDYTLNNQNIGLAGLNVSQYYDVVTDPTDNNYIYAGTQDQGWQKAFTFFNHDSPADFDQVTSGDYGHLTFSKNGTHLWMVYPWGSVSLWKPKTGEYIAGYTLESDDESTWIPPMMESANPEEDVIYLAGGNIFGGPGSHIVRLEYDGYEIQTSQLPFDFKAASGGEITAIEISKVNPLKWYVATSNGRFYYSEDGGETFLGSNVNGPGPQYLYGSTILASKHDENIVYFGGSGYSVAGIYKSTNGGKSFSSMVQGLPQTLTYELAANEDETLLFAGTESGPYVYVVTEEKWYDMAIETAPTQRYWSVEYVASEDRVRFGTYGRGIFDFQIEEFNTATKSTLSKIQTNLSPNPGDQYVDVHCLTCIGENWEIHIVNQEGKLIEVGTKVQFLNDGKERIDISGLIPGVYLVIIKNEQSISNKRFIKI